MFWAFLYRSREIIGENVVLGPPAAEHIVVLLAMGPMTPVMSGSMT